MRTLDSGIGTFPLPDSITRASCRYIPKSESGQSDGVTPSSSELESDTLSRSDPCYPHSLQKTDQHTAASVTLSDSNVTYRRTSQSCLSKLATTGTLFCNCGVLRLFLFMWLILRDLFYFYHLSIFCMRADLMQTICFSANIDKYSEVCVSKS